MIQSKQQRYMNLGLLILRVGIGFMFAIGHGLGKVQGGTESWEKLGGAMAYAGLDFAPVFWGFMAAMAEFMGAIFIAIGLFTRPSAFLLLITMIVAVLAHTVGRQQAFFEASHAAESAILFLSLIFIGPGRYSLDAILFDSKK